jgi:hypothetical protein
MGGRDPDSWYTWGKPKKVKERRGVPSAGESHQEAISIPDHSIVTKPSDEARL